MKPSERRSPGGGASGSLWSESSDGLLTSRPVKLDGMAALGGTLVLAARVSQLGAAPRVGLQCGRRCGPHVGIFSQTLPLSVLFHLLHSFIFFREAFHFPY